MNAFPRCCCACQMCCNDPCNCTPKHPCCDCFPTRCAQFARTVSGMDLPKKRSSKRCSCNDKLQQTQQQQQQQLPQQRKRERERDQEASSNMCACPQSKSRHSQSPSRSSKEAVRKRSEHRTDTKQTKNNQNYYYQDMLDQKHMDVIDEEKENFEDEYYGNSSDYSDAKKIQDSCADFLSIVHDNVLETVKKTVENVLGDYFMHTMEKIENVSSQMLRNECLLSKMYLDLLEKITAQSDKSVRQFKCVCRLLADGRSCEGLSKNPFSRTPMHMPTNSQSNIRASPSARSEITVAHATISRNSGSRKGSELDFSQSMTATERALACATPTLRPKIRSSEISNTSLTDQLQRARYQKNSRL